jgi:hypothetical protein
LHSIRARLEPAQPKLRHTIDDTLSQRSVPKKQLSSYMRDADKKSADFSAFATW